MPAHSRKGLRGGGEARECSRVVLRAEVGTRSGTIKCQKGGGKEGVAARYRGCGVNLRLARSRDPYCKPTPGAGGIFGSKKVRTRISHGYQPPGAPLRRYPGGLDGQSRGLRCYAASTVVTVAIEDIEFKTPIKQGELVELVARVEEVGRTSMRVWVEVIREIPMDDHRELCMVGYFTMVALGEDGTGRSPYRHKPERNNRSTPGIEVADTGSGSFSCRFRRCGRGGGGRKLRYPAVGPEQLRRLDRGRRGSSDGAREVRAYRGRRGFLVGSRAVLRRGRCPSDEDRGHSLGYTRDAGG